MMRIAVGIAVLTLALSGMVYGNGVNYVALAVEFAFNADFTESNSQLMWTGGNGATVYTYDAPYQYTFDTINVAATFTGMTDLNPSTPAPSQAKARFTACAWTISMSDTGTGNTIDVGGDLVLGGPWNGYLEEEDGPDTNHLLGAAWVRVTSASTNIVGLGWEAGVNPIAGMQATTAVDEVGGVIAADIDNYQTDWSSEDVILLIYTDESNVVPEPATIGLLALGTLVLARRRRR